ncbi:acyl-CoA dehydrogenase family protein [Mycobacterium sp. 236(2023)]|uniref:acyl-CoA dehydrogenase family protein n=1 Tax=Mycobacterium sp. 236(2023) TaxID=3038163 RepID=UPI00241526B0|nr:acyl-CoA dehydrogenase family protein [Mycobacterium sp. 236(2023)]MDG4668048.1 acyl-CoA/acyl-ACP dehydrogenase [Mycobacterium sp. 236(2023)]
MPLPTSDHDELRAATRDVLAHYFSSKQIRAQSESPQKFDADLWRIGTELGWTALSVPDEHGGLGLSVPETCIVAEEFGRAAAASPLSVTLGCALLISTFGSDALKAQWLPRVAEGTAILSWGTDYGASRQSPSLTLSARGDGFVLNGVLEWLPDATAAAGLLVCARYGEQDCLVMVDSSTEGATVTPMQSLDICRLHGRLECVAVNVPAESVLDGDSARTLFDLAVIIQCAEAVGLASSVLEMTAEYLKTRVQFGRPIGTFQALKHRAADMLVHREAARAITWEAAAVLADSPSDASEAASTAKSIAGRAGSSIASEALQLHGGIGFTWEHDLHLFLRKLKVAELLLGSPAWHERRLISMLRPRLAAL